MRRAYGLLILIWFLVLMACRVWAGVPSNVPVLSDPALQKFLKSMADHLNTLECLTADPNGSVLGTHGELKCANYGGADYVCMNTGDSTPAKGTDWTCLNLAGGGLTGSGTTNQIAYWSGISSLTGSTQFTIDTANTRVRFFASPTREGGGIQSSLSGSSYGKLTIYGGPLAVAGSAMSLTDNPGESSFVLDPASSLSATTPSLSLNASSLGLDTQRILRLVKAADVNINFDITRDSVDDRSFNLLFNPPNTGANVDLTFPTSTGTLALAADVVPNSRNLTAGAGLTGGGDLSSDRTFDVGAGTGITVNANDIALTVQTAAGQWTPTTNNIANFGSSTAAEGQYIRVGSVVTGSIQITVDPTLSATTTELELDLPVASDFGATSDAAGACGGSDVASEVAEVRADATSNELEVLWVTTSLASHEIACSFSYQIL